MPKRATLIARRYIEQQPLVYSPDESNPERHEWTFRNRNIRVNFTRNVYEEDRVVETLHVSEADDELFTATIVFEPSINPHDMLTNLTVRKETRNLLNERKPHTNHVMACLSVVRAAHKRLE